MPSVGDLTTLTCCGTLREQPQRGSVLLFTCALFALNIVVYWGSFNAGLFADDLMWQKVSLDTLQSGSLLSWRGVDFKFRPVLDTLLTLNMWLFGRNTWGLHTISFAGHFGAALLLYFFAIRLTGSRSVACISSLVFTCLPCSASAIYGNDCCQEPLMVAAGLFLLLMTIPPHEEHAGRKYVLNGKSVLCASGIFILCVLSLLLKETAMGYIALACIAIGVYSMRHPQRLVLSYSFLFILAMVSSVCAYAILRSATAASYVMPSEGPLARYQLSVGTNVVKNYALLLMGMCVPTATPSVVIALHRLGATDVALLAATGVSSLLIIGAGVIGIISLWRSGRREGAFLLMVGILLSLGPVVLLQRVSELYAFSAVPFFSVILGTGVCALYEKCRRYRKVRYLFLLVCACLLLSGLFAMQTKKCYLVRNGNIVRMLDRAVEEVVRVHGDQAVIEVGLAAPDPVSYSVYLFRNLSSLYYPSHRNVRCGIPGDDSMTPADAQRSPDVRLLWTSDGVVATGLSQERSCIVTGSD